MNKVRICTTKQESVESLKIESDGAGVMFDGRSVDRLAAKAGLWIMENTRIHANN